MIFFCRPFRILFFALLTLAPGMGRALTVVPGAFIGGGIISSPCVVDGFPAIAWSVYHSDTVWFVRATDATGAAWGAPVMVVQRGAVGFVVCLRVVNGKPAICYHDGELRYVRAQDPAGTVWGAPVTVPTPGFPATTRITMEVIDGHPAIAYAASSLSVEQMFIRASDANGTAWGPPVVVDASGSYNACSLKTVQGRPAIAYSNSAGLRYVRALDADGTAWAAPAPASAEFPNIDYTSMEIADGRPAIGYRSGQNIMYVRAADAAGTAWDPPVRLNEAGVQSQYASMAITGGRPGVAWMSLSPQELKYAQATDGAGATAAAWGPPVTADQGQNTGLYPTVFTVGDRPAIVYYHGSRGLEYLGASDGTGSTWAPPRLEVRDYNGIPIADESTVDFKLVRVGMRSSRTFVVANVQTGHLLISGVTLDGPDAAEFTLTVPPPDTLGPGASGTFQLDYLPVKPGIKSAALHFTSNSEGGSQVFDLILTANSAPGISVWAVEGDFLEDGSVLLLPAMPGGSATDFQFAIANRGAADLTGLAITVDGPDSAAFTIPVPPQAVLTPETTTTFTLRYAPATSGNRMAALHIANNLTGAKNPFDLTIRTAPGLIDPFFKTLTGMIRSLAVQPDGRILAGVPRSLLRFNPDGTPDNFFFSPSLDGFMNDAAVESGGTLLIGGNFKNVSGNPHAGLARLFPDGSPDESFAPVPGPDATVAALAVQVDGKILVGGTTGEMEVPFLTRFNTDGSVDPGFHAEPQGRITCLTTQTDGRILVGGGFGFGRITRLNADGTPDAFTAILDYDVLCLAELPDGRIYASGDFTGGVARLLPDGSADPSMSFQLAGTVRGLALQADGKCVAGAGYSFIGAPGLPFKIVRLDAGGSLDTTFNPDGSVLGFNAVERLAMQADGAVLIGKVPAIDLDPGPNLVRLLSDAAFVQLNIESPSTVRWLRSGAAPEVSSVTFDVKPGDFRVWLPLGPARRIPGGWELTGLTLHSPGQIRARGRAGGSLYESVTSLPSPLESWRLQYFSTSENTGPAADDADPDNDGLTNFTEYAFGLIPVDRASNALPEFKYDGTFYTGTFTVLEGRENLLYSAEQSSTMQPGTWAAIPDTGTVGTHVFTVPAAEGTMFVRFVVTK
jgi:uncharacterized delta-60 repeat protein